MRTMAQIKEIASTIYDKVTENLNSYTDKRTIKVKDSITVDIDDVGSFIKGVSSVIENTVVEYDEETYTLPRYYCSIEDYTDDGCLSLLFKSEINVRPKYRRVIKLITDDNISDKIIKRTLDVIFEMFYMEMAKQNLNMLNQDLKKICQSASVSYTFGFGFDPYNSSMILSINDNEVIFNATQKSALNLASRLMYSTGSEFYTILAGNEIATLKKQIQTCQTTVQLIKSKIKLIEDLTGITTRTRASKLIRQTYHRQVKNFDIVKQTCIGYFNEEVMIDGEPVEIFALVKKEKDEKDGTKGKQEVILQPFDVKTNFVVNYDVLNHKYE